MRGSSWGQAGRVLMPGLSRLRVVIVTPKGFLGGAERWLLAVLDATSRLQIEVVCLADGPLVGHLRERGIAVTVVPTGPSPADMARSSRRLHRIMRSTDPDVVLANGIKAAVTALPVTRLLGIPGVWVRHDPNYDSTLGVAAARLARRVIVVAPPTPTEERRFRPTFIPPPLLAEPLSCTDAVAHLQALGVPDDGRKRVGMFCRLAQYKGVDVAIRALARAPSWRLVIAGVVDPGERDDEELRLRELAQDVGVDDRVTWLGEVPSAGSLAAGLDAVAMLTRAGVPGYPDAEGFGMTLVEAYAAGIPVIADPRTVPPLRVPEYAGGAIEVDATDPVAVAQALATVCEATPAVGRRTAALAAAAAHPRPVEVARRLVAVMAEVSHRPGVGHMGRSALTTADPPSRGVGPLSGADGPPMSVVATVFNEGPEVERAVGEWLSLARCDDEVVVVDGGSQDDTVARLRRLSRQDARLRVIEAPGAGISTGRNIGIRAARHDWIAGSDAGCRPGPTWLAGLRAAAASGAADLVTGVYAADPGQHRLWETALRAVAYPRPEELRRSTPLVCLYGRLFGRVYDASLPTGRSLALTKDAWRSVGGYPEHLATGEDVTFGKAIVRMGGRAVLAQDAVVVWGQRGSLRANLTMFFRYGIGDGESRDFVLIARNSARGAAYIVGPAMMASRRLRPLAVAGAVLYLSLPMKRALLGPRPLATAAVVPAIAAARDLSKVVGCLVGVSRRP